MRKSFVQLYAQGSCTMHMHRIYFPFPFDSHAAWWTARKGRQSTPDKSTTEIFLHHLPIRQTILYIPPLVRRKASEHSSATIAYRDVNHSVKRGFFPRGKLTLINGNTRLRSSRNEKIPKSSKPRIRYQTIVDSIALRKRITQSNFCRWQRSRDANIN